MTFKNRQPATKLSLLSLGAVAALSLNAQAVVFSNGGFDDYTGTPANGDLFSTLTPSSWLAFGNLSQSTLKTTAPGLTSEAGGFYAGIFQQNSGISQTFDTTVGYTYRVDFFVATQQAPDGAKLQADVFNGSDFTGSLATLAGTLPAAADTWEARTMSFTATSTISTLRFLEAGGSVSDSFVDTVGLTITAVPEPSSAALIGLGGIALILRRRK